MADFAISEVRHGTSDDKGHLNIRSHSQINLFGFAGRTNPAEFAPIICGRIQHKARIKDRCGQGSLRTPAFSAMLIFAVSA